jgi:hypothetical protein
MFGVWPTTFRLLKPSTTRPSPGGCAGCWPGRAHRSRRGAARGLTDRHRGAHTPPTWPPPPRLRTPPRDGPTRPCTDPVALLAQILDDRDAVGARSTLAIATVSAEQTANVQTPAELLADAAQLAATERTGRWLDQLTDAGHLTTDKRGRWTRSTSTTSRLSPGTSDASTAALLRSREPACPRRASAGAATTAARGGAGGGRTEIVCRTCAQARRSLSDSVLPFCQ